MCYVILVVFIFQTKAQIFASNYELNFMSSCLIEHILAQVSTEDCSLVGPQKILGLEELSASSLEETVADIIPFPLSYLDLLFKPH